jgi:hypothetical protein
MHPELDRLLDPDYVEQLADLDMDEVRARRAACQHREESLSYLRRVVQVRLDLLGTELQRRQDGAAPATVDELLARLPQVLSEHSRAPGLGQAPRELQLPEIDDELAGVVDGIVGPRQLGTLHELDTAQLSGIIDRLEALEHEVSATRRQLHSQIDRLQSEITRRYRSGEASVDALLQ